MPTTRRTNRNTYHGKRHTCGGTLRYKSNGKCISCQRKPAKSDPKVYEYEPKVEDPRPGVQGLSVPF